MNGSIVRSFVRGASDLLLLAAGGLVVPAAYLGLLTAVGLPRSRSGAGSRERPVSSFAVLVPAHNEAAGIAPTLDSLRQLDYPFDRFSVHVVADNCSDDTAEVVRSSGFDVHERVGEPGKGPALNWLFDRLVARGETFDAVVVVDADTTVDPDFLRAMDVAIRTGAVVAQGFYSVRDPSASPATSFRFAALACRHHLRPLGRRRLGASCGLYGNGMAFRRDVLETRRWSGHLVEDAQFQIELLLDGDRVTYVPEARVWAEMPEDLEGAVSQNERWERGRHELARRYVPTLARSAFTQPRRRTSFVDAVVDLLVPPLSVLVVAQALVAVLAAAITPAGHRSSRRALLLVIYGQAAVAAHVVAGLFAIRAPAEHYLALSSAPRIVLWKAKLWLGIAGSRAEVAWTRTQRNIEQEVDE